MRKTLLKMIATRQCGAAKTATVGLIVAGAAAITPAHGAEVPYQNRIALECSNNSCTGGTGIVPAGQRITVRFISCVLVAPGAAEYSFGDFSAIKPDDQLNPLFQQFLVPQHRNGNGSWLINQETEAVIRPNQQGYIRLATDAGNPTAAVCSLAGSNRIRP